MATKRKTIENPKSCLNKADDDEPIFVLRAKDPIASLVVRIWASLSDSLNAHEADKIRTARAEAQDMEIWRDKVYGHPRIDWGG